VREPIIKTILGLTGLVAIATGANIGFGGIATLGIDGPTEFFQVSDPDTFALRDSNVRFVGGLWLGIGLLFVAATFWLDRLRQAVLAALALIIVGGLARLTAGDLTILASAKLGPSLAAELVLMPMLFWRIWAGGRSTG